MAKSDFDRLMERYLKGEVSPEEKTKIEAWLETVRSKEAIDLELSQEEEERIFAKLTSRLSTEGDVVALDARTRKGGHQWILRIAASLLIVCMLSYTAWYFAHLNNNALTVVARNGVEKIILNDGSLVWLRGDSKLIFYDKRDDGTRYSTFEGEALFEVSKDPEHPFILDCGGVKVRVVGTSFSIRTTIDMIELTVLTGKVNLSTPSNADGVDVVTKEKVIFKSNGQIEKLTTTPQEIILLTENTEYNMRFRNDGLDQVVRRIENKFNVEVEFPDEDIGNCRITADFTDTSLEASLQMIGEILDATYSIKDHTVTISGKGCN